MLRTIDHRGSSVEKSSSNVFSSRSVVNAVAVNAGHFHDPGDDANPDTEVEVVAGVP